MANRILTTNGTTSSGTWYGIEAINVSLIQAGANSDALNTERTIPVTFSNAGNQIGIVLVIRNAGATTGNFTIKLEENVGGTWTLRTTDTYVTTLFDSYFYSPIYFALTSYAVTTGANTWRYKVSHTSASMNLVRSSTASDWFYAVALDYSTANPSSGDWIAVANGVTFTTNASWTFGGAINYTSGVLCYNATWQINEGAAATTYTMTAPILIGTHGTSQIGTSLSKVSAANKVTIDISNSTSQSTTIRAVFQNPQRDYFSNRNGQFSFLWYGQEYANIRAKTSATALSSQANLVLTQDLSSTWQTGDKLTIIGSYGDANTERTISSVSGTTVTITANLSQNVYKNAGIINLTASQRNLGIYIYTSQTTGTHALYVYAYYPKTMKIYGVLSMAGIVAWGFENYPGITSYTQSHVLQSICFDRSNITSAVPSVGTTSEQSVFNLTVSNVHVYRPTFHFGAGVSFSSITNSSVSNVTAGLFDNVGISLINATNLTVSDIISGGTSQSIAVNRASIVVTGSNITMSNVYGLGRTAVTSQGVLYLKVNGSTISDSVFEGVNANNVYLDSSSVVKFIDCTFGSEQLATNSIYAIDYSYTTCLFENCLFGSVIGNYTGMTAGSYISSDTHNQTANTHLNYYPYGIISSTGDGLTDTTVRTSGTGKFALRFEPLSSTNNLTWDFTVPTGNIQNLTMTMFMWVKINSATYYAGTHQKPRLSINYDNGTTSYAEATGSTDWQLLHVTFTPTTTYGQITVTVSGKTDATGSDAYFYIDDFGIAYPPNVALDLGGLDNWANGLPVVPPLSLPISAGTVAQAVALEVPGQIKYIDGGEIPIY